MRFANLKSLVVISLFLGFLVSTASGGRIIKVPLDFEDIQAAIDDANDGDMVLVSSGTYRGLGNRDIDFAGKAITVCSESGAMKCIIDCEGSADEHHLGFVFHSGEGPNSILDGFTIINGYHEDAGAILCTYFHISDPRPSSPTITDCVISNNQGTYAGAIRCTSGCEPVISNCVISDNTGFYAGGLSYADESRPVVSSCIFRGNRGQTGGGIRTGGARCHGTIRNCVISCNSATSGAAGVHWWSYGGSVEITNCTIVGNEDELWAGGIVIGGGDGTTGTITNCIIRGNRGLDWPLAQIYLWPDADPPTTAEVTYCNVQGGWPGEGNIDADPLFVEPGYWDTSDIWIEGDYRLRAGSPCIDAGTDAEVYTDIEGNIRPFDFPGADNNGGLSDFDIGAYEVIAKPEGEMNILPRTISRQGQRILAALHLPEPISGDDIDMYEPLVLYPGSIEATEQNLQYKPAQSEVKIHAVFDESELLAASPGDGDIEVTVIGRFISGQYFYCTDQVRIINTQR